MYKVINYLNAYIKRTFEYSVIIPVEVKIHVFMINYYMYMNIHMQLHVYELLG